MRSKKWIIPAIAAMLVLSACGETAGVGSIGNDFGSSKSSFITNSPSYESSYDSAESDSSGDMSNAEIVKNTMMVVRDADLSVDVQNLEEFAESLTSKVNDMDGYFETSEIDNYSSDYQTSRDGYFTIRIPSQKLDDFLNFVDGDTFITSKRITTEDVSLEYVDIEAHISALENERDNLNRLLDEAENVADVIEIENRLSDVQYQLDSYTSQKKVLEGRVSYSTVNIRATEERNVEHPIRKAFEINFAERMVDGIEQAAETFVGIIAAIPVIIIVTAFGFLFLWILHKIWKKIFKRKGSYIKYIRVPVQMQDGTEQEMILKAEEHKPESKKEKVVDSEDDPNPEEEE